MSSGIHPVDFQNNASLLAEVRTDILWSDDHCYWKGGSGDMECFGPLFVLGFYGLSDNFSFHMCCAGHALYWMNYEAETGVEPKWTVLYPMIWDALFPE